MFVMRERLYAHPVDCRLDLSGSEQGQVVGFCECGNELPGFIKCGEYLD
jgi:hypothetical protein